MIKSDEALGSRAGRTGRQLHCTGGNEMKDEKLRRRPSEERVRTARTEILLMLIVADDRHRIEMRGTREASDDWQPAR